MTWKCVSEANNKCHTTISDLLHRHQFHTFDAPVSRSQVSLQKKPWTAAMVVPRLSSRGSDCFPAVVLSRPDRCGRCRAAAPHHADGQACVLLCQRRLPSLQNSNNWKQQKNIHTHTKKTLPKTLPKWDARATLLLLTEPKLNK